MSDSEQSDLNSGPVDYGQHRYWDQRYKKSEGKRFQWLQPFQNLREEIEQLVNHNQESKILNIGCGNSAIQDQLYKVGYHCITNNDISSVVIDQMNEVKEQKGYQKMIYEVMDVRQMKYKNETFDLIIDKSTIDALMCSDSPFVSTAQMVEQCYRVLKPGGYYFVISYAENRAEHILRKHVNWEMKMYQKKRQNEEGEELVHYLYICKKIPLGDKSLNQEEKQEFYHHLKKEQQEYYK